MSSIIDSHHHLWNYSEAEYGWISPEMSALRRDFTPQMLFPELTSVGIDGTVAVQARQTLAETDWLLSLAENSPFIKGVVGWFPLSDPALENEIDLRLRFSASVRLVGVRHVVQDEPDPLFILGDDFNRGVDILERYGLIYDILVAEHQLPAAMEFVDRHPNQFFVLDHAAKPRIAAEELEPWSANLSELARRGNVSCKVSGIVTEANWNSWTPESLKPYLDHIFEAFGPRRLMFGSDWPVCLLAAEYREWYQTVKSYCAGLSPDEQEWVFGRSAELMYGLEEL
jgi:L-fuconolactonase